MEKIKLRKQKRKIRGNFRLGQKVLIINSFNNYSMYRVFAKHHHLDKWIRGDSPREGDIGRLILVDDSFHPEGDVLYVVEINNQQYILGNASFESLAQVENFIPDQLFEI